MVEREAVRLGVQFQVGGKWCSFVAVESHAEEAEKQRKEAQGWQWIDDQVDAVQSVDGQGNQQTLFRSLLGAQHHNHHMSAGRPPSSTFGNPAPFGGNVGLKTGFGASKPMSSSGGLFGSSNAVGSSAGFGAASSFGAPSFGSSGGGLFGGASNNTLYGAAPSSNSGGGLFGGVSSNTGYGAAPQASSTLFGAPPQVPQIGSSLFSAPTSRQSQPLGAIPPPPPGSSSLFGAQSPSNNSGSVLFGAPAPAPAQSQPNSGASLFGAAPPPANTTSLRDYQSGLMLLEQQNKKRLFMARQENDSNTVAKTSDTQPPASVTGEALLHYLISLQSFEGSWSLSSELLGVLGLDEAAVKAQMQGVDEKVAATVLVIAVLEKRLEGLRGSWELVGDKGRAWLEGEVGDGNVEEWVQRGKKVLGDD